MKTLNNTPFQVEVLVDKDAELNNMLTVIIKATYDFNPSGGSVHLSTKQLPIIIGDEMTESEPVPGLRYESDMVPFKPKGDFVIVGHAISLERSVPELDVGFRLGELEKVVRVFGDRVWQTSGMMGGLGMSLPEPFTELELTFDHSFGGIDMTHAAVCEANPSGMGIFHKKTKKAEILGQPLPNVEDPNNLIKSWKDKPEPVGMGFVAKGTCQRIKFMGTYDEVWKKSRNPDRPVDFDFQYFNAAPADQQLDSYFTCDEIIELLNLTPDRSQVSFQLPNVHPQAFVKRKDITSKEKVTLNLDTVCVISKACQFYLVWRGWVPINDPLMQDMETLTIEP